MNMKCSHPSKDMRYEQLNQYPSSEGITAEAILGSQYYVWRVEFCGRCKVILKKIGNVPEWYNKFKSVA